MAEALNSLDFPGPKPSFHWYSLLILTLDIDPCEDCWPKSVKTLTTGVCQIPRSLTEYFLIGRLQRYPVTYRISSKSVSRDIEIPDTLYETCTDMLIISDGHSIGEPSKVFGQGWRNCLMPNSQCRVTLSVAGVWDRRDQRHLVRGYSQDSRAHGPQAKLFVRDSKVT